MMGELLSKAPDTASRQAVAADVQRSVEGFIFKEAQYADEHRYDEWLALWDDTDVFYWAPCNDDDADPVTSISLISDNRRGLEERVTRLKTRAAYSQRPRSRLRRLISNIVVEADSVGVVHAAANFLTAELRTGHQDIFAGRVSYELRVRDGSYRIARKKVLLLNNDDYIDNMSFIV